MAMKKYSSRPVEQILIDGAFLSRRDLELALEEQKHTNELLGQVLVRMGFIDPVDIQAALSVQAYLHLGRLEDAVRVAAGVRRKLGELLIHSGLITKSQLEQALAEQKITGNKLGEELVLLGLLTRKQLKVLLVFQRIQDETIPAPGPLRLGELLVVAGCLSRQQLDAALSKQSATRKHLGELLIEEGYVEPHHIKRGLRLQEMLLAAVLAALLTGCGSGSLDDNTISNPTTTTKGGDASVASNSFIISSNEYDILKPNFYYSTNNEKFWSIQAALAQSIWDEDYKCVVRIDIQKSAAGEMPAINKTFSIEENPLYERFPGAFLVFNGERSVRNKIESGILSFTADSTASGTVHGSFDLTLTDYDSAIVPVPRYHLTGSFTFKMGSYGPADS